MSEPKLKAAWFASIRSRSGVVKGIEGLFTESRAQELNFLYLADRDAYNARKATLPCYAVSTAHPHRKRDNGDAMAAKHTGLIAIDIDGFETPAEAENVRDLMMDLTGCITSFLSPSYHGVKGIFCVDPIPKTAAEHTLAWGAVAARVEEKLEVPVDDSGKDVTRMTYCSWDPIAEFWDDIPPLKWQKHAPADNSMDSGTIERPQTHTEGAQGAKSGGGDIPVSMDLQRHLAGWSEPASCWAAMRDAACDFWMNWTTWEMYANLTPQSIIDCLTRFAKRTNHERYLGPEIERLVRETCEKFERGTYTPKPYDKATWALPPDSDGESGGDDDGPTMLSSNLHDHRGIVEEVLDDKTITVRYNTRSCRIEYSYLIGGVWIELTDGFFHEFRNQLRSDYCVMRNDQNKKPYPWPVKISEADLHSVFKAIGHGKQVDPFEDWLYEKVATTRWDGEHRLERLYIDLFGAEDTPLVRWAGRYLFLAIIQRTEAPACQLDEFPVLIGKQGIGKSQHLRYLFPEEHRNDWFSDDFDMSRSDQKKFESTRGFALIEMSEMAGFGAKEIEALKRYITSKVDVQRVPYARVVESYPRRFVFVATTNNDTPLPNDPSGNRRFVPIRLEHGANVEVYMNDNREQLWAEAYHMYRNGEIANLSRDLYPLQCKAAEGARNVDSIVEEMVAALPKETMTFTEISEKLRLIASDMDEGNLRLMSFPDTTRIRNALKVAGWSQPTNPTRFDGRMGRWWFPPLGG